MVFKRIKFAAHVKISSQQSETRSQLRYQKIKNKTAFPSNLSFGLRGGPMIYFVNFFWLPYGWDWRGFPGLGGREQRDGGRLGPNQVEAVAGENGGGGRDRCLG